MLAEPDWSLAFDQNGPMAKARAARRWQSSPSRYRYLHTALSLPAHRIRPWQRSHLHVETGAAAAVELNPAARPDAVGQQWRVLGGLVDVLNDREHVVGSLGHRFRARQGFVVHPEAHRVIATVGRSQQSGTRAATALPLPPFPTRCAQANVSAPDALAPLPSEPVERWQVPTASR